jgi:hypothetical protein
MFNNDMYAEFRELGPPRNLVVQARLSAAVRAQPTAHPTPESYQQRRGQNGSTVSGSPQNGA